MLFSKVSTVAVSFLLHLDKVLQIYLFEIAMTDAGAAEPEETPSKTSAVRFFFNDDSPEENEASCPAARTDNKRLHEVGRATGDGDHASGAAAGEALASILKKEANSELRRRMPENESPICNKVVHSLCTCQHSRMLISHNSNVERSSGTVSVRDDYVIGQGTLPYQAPNQLG